MSIKKRVINGLNFIYNSGPQKRYRDGTRHSRWTLVVDEDFLKIFDGKIVPSSVLAEADALEVFLPDKMSCNPISWEESAAAKIKRVSAQMCSFPLKHLKIDSFRNLHEIRGRGNNFPDLDLSCFEHLELASVFDLTDSKLLKGCKKLYELLLWSTDIAKLDPDWLANCSQLRLLEFIECSGFENLQMMPTVEFLRVVRPSKSFALSTLLKSFPSARSLDIQGIRMPQIDCHLPDTIELFIANGKILKTTEGIEEPLD